MWIFVVGVFEKTPSTQLFWWIFLKFVTLVVFEKHMKDILNISLKPPSLKNLKTYKNSWENLGWMVG